MLLGCFDIFVDSIHNVALEEELVDFWHIERNQKQMLAFGHLQGLIVYKMLNLKKKWHILWHKKE
jgi:hypothetical protein